ncbi:hypothetical protein MNV49_005349 [Pseudohyphozyma bogoriensis]|nr:hypothetical protein MNV49_005349 [Pseudohyphozyma bogoriensis]
MRNYTLWEAQHLWLHCLPKNLERYLGSPEEAERYQASLNFWVNWFYNTNYVPNVLLPYLPSTASLPPLARRIETAIARHVVLAPSVGTQALQPIRTISQHGRFAALSDWTTIHVPTRIHTLAISAFVILNVGILLGPYDVLESATTQSRMLLLTRFMADRSGLLAFALTPLSVVLASRNSPISYFTGATFATLQIYHRWIARTTVFHAVAHAFGYTVVVWSRGGSRKFLRMFNSKYWNWGCIAVAGGIVLCFGSMRRIREKWYELFLGLHIFANVAWLAGCFYHVWYLEKDHPLLWHIYLALALWLADRVLRRVGMMALNYRRRGLKVEQSTSGTGVLIGNQYLRLRLSPAQAWPDRAGGPGTYVFISLPTFAGMRQAHPITIAWPMGMDAINSPSSDLGSSKTSAAWNEAAKSSSSSNEFELVIKVYEGFTRELQQTLVRKSPKEVEDSAEELSIPVQLVVQGPYGTPEELDDFGVLLLVSGGTGVAATIAHLARLAKALEKGELEMHAIFSIHIFYD